MRAKEKAKKARLLSFPLSYLLVILGVVLSVGVVAGAAEIFVGPDAETISEGLAMAEPNDTIIVLPGYDSETVGEPFPIWVGIEGVTIRCEQGARIAIPSSNAGFVVQADGVTIESCEITSETGADPTDPTTLGDIGILVADVADVALLGNWIHDLLQGIRLINTTYSNIEDNVLYEIGAMSNGKRGGIAIQLEKSKDNDLIDNEAYNSGIGLFLIRSWMNRVDGDQYYNNSFIGVHLEISYENSFEGISVYGNGGDGVALVASDRNTIKYSDLSKNERVGIKLMSSSSNVVKGNNIHDNGNGIDEDINILLTRGTVVEFYAELQPNQEAIEEIRREKHLVETKVKEVKAEIIELDEALAAMRQKLETAIGITVEIINTPCGPAKDAEVARLKLKVAEVRAEITAILDKIAGIHSQKGEIIDEIMAIKNKLRLLLCDPEAELHKLEAVIGILEDIDAELDLIADKLYQPTVADPPVNQLLPTDEEIDAALRDTCRPRPRDPPFDDIKADLIAAKLILEDAIREKEFILPKVERIFEKLSELNKQLPDTIWSNLVGKVDGFSLTEAQVAALREELAARLNADPAAKAVALCKFGRPWRADDITFERADLGGSAENIIASNVITSAIVSDMPQAINIGIKLEAGTENKLINNLITNEDIENGRGGRFGTLTVGIMLLTSENQILFNAIEFLNTGIVRGGAQQRIGAKYILLFKKLALVRCQADPVECCGQARAIVSEVTEERLDLDLPSARVTGNRIALNLLEQNGVGIDVIDAESNVIDENLFLKNTNDAIRLGIVSPSIRDIKILENDFKGNGAAVNNADITISTDASDNFFGDPSGPFHELRNPEGTGDQVIGKANVSPWATTPYCKWNFEKEIKFKELGIVEFFWGGLPPNIGLLPEKVFLPEEKPRLCSDIFGDGPPHMGSPPAFPDKTDSPHDLDGDGLYEDVNGNGRLDFDDSVTLALYIDRVLSEDQSYFDFNGNGRLDFDDAVRLAFRVGGKAAVQALKAMFSATELKVTAITASPNPVTGVATVNFTVEGVGIAETRVQVFDLGGKLVFDSDFVAGNQLAWNLMNERGEALANGVYLYIVTVKGVSGELLRSEVKKIVLLR